MIEEIEKREQEEVMQLRQQVQELTQQVQEVSNYAKQLETTNKQLLGQLNDNQNRMKSMQKEYSDKINQAREYILAQQEKEKAFGEQQQKATQTE